MDRESPISSGERAWPRDFARLWLAQGASVAAQQVAELALPLLAVLVLHASAMELGLLGVARWLPFLLLALPLGVLVDRHRRRPLIVASDWARAAITLAIVAASVAGVLSFPALAALAAAIGCFTVLFEVSYQSVLPSVVPTSALAGANTRLAATASAVQVGGPGLGGLLVQAVAAPFALLVTAGGYIVSAISVACIRAPEAPSGRSGGFLAELRSGLRFVARDRYLVANLGFSALYNPFIQWILVLFTLYAVQELGLDAAQLGLILAIGAVGALAGSMLAGRMVRRFGAGRPIMWCAAVNCLALFAVPVADASWGAPWLIAGLGAVFAMNGASATLSSVILVTIRQLRTPDRLLGRVNASMRWVSFGTIALGAAAGGFAGELLGTRAALAIGAMLSVGSLVWVALSPLPRIGNPGELAIAERREPDRAAAEPVE
ncbi:MFS transporter [Agromyces sp. SYSU K20354]|uniref:MFS transporter n=1 Tax=Agromyces cavernae TaxID=2898659 RepID=UPI001E5C5910|nr:MFS transporter [Agromyces cavernae]MCD2443051.1 MFS transporter [Agromyces cavernae]